MEVLMAASLKCAGGFSSALASSDSQPIRQNGLSGSISINKKRPSEVGEHQWKSLKMARTEPHRSNTPDSLFSWGEQMLSFSSSKKDDALLFDCEGNLLDYNSQSAEESVSSSSESSDVGNGGLGSRGMNTRINVGGPFTPSQMNELQQQIFIFRCIEANVPIPSELLISFGKRPIPPDGPSTFSSGLPRPRTSEAGILQLGFVRYPDMEPGRCRRTDGKKWRCSRNAVENHKYCDRHINRGRHRSRKLVERHKSSSSSLAPSTALSPLASSVSGSETSSSRLPIAQMQMENLPLNFISNSSSAQLNRVLVNEQNVNSRKMGSQDLSSMQYSHLNSFDTLIPSSIEPTPFAGSSSLHNSVLSSDDSLFNLPTSSFLENASFPSSYGFHSEEQNFLDNYFQPSCSSFSNSHGGQMQSCAPQFTSPFPVSSSEFSSGSSSAFPEHLTLSPLNLSDDFASFDVGRGAQQIPNAASWDPVAWAASMGGPLGEVLANKSNVRTEDMNCLLSSTSRTEEWGRSSEFCSSSTNALQNYALIAATSPSAASSSKLWEDFLGSGNVNSSTFPPYKTT